jgi:uncharacterized protein YjbI with pentapeptide repeats
LKRTLEVEKLALERKALERQLSLQGVLINWLQVASVPVALLGAVLAFFIGYGQLRQGQDTQVSERFDRALTHLASDKWQERMAGVSGLELFFYDNTPLQKQALRSLINGLSVETDTRVRGAILDVLADLKPGNLSKAALDEGLRTAIERDRSLTKSILDGWRANIVDRQKQILAKFKIQGLDPDSIHDQIPAQLIATLTTEQYLALLDAEHGPFEDDDPSQDVPLGGLRSAIETLLVQGATAQDFKNLNCEYCNFSSVKFPDQTVFDGSYLAGANFEHASLHGASFADADVGGTNFFDADLTGARLTTNFLGRGHAARGFGYQLPLLECANLQGADLTGLPLVLFVKSFTTSPIYRIDYKIVVPRMVSTKLNADTKLDNFKIVTAILISDAYIKQHPEAEEVKYLTTTRDNLWPIPITNHSWASVGFRRLHGDYAQDASAYTDTIAMTDWQVDPGVLGKDAFMLLGFVDQPALQVFPEYSQFRNAVRVLANPGGEAGMAATLRSYWATSQWKTMKPQSCDGHPAPLTLLFGL